MKWALQKMPIESSQGYYTFGGLLPLSLEYFLQFKKITQRFA